MSGLKKPVTVFPRRSSARQVCGSKRKGALFQNISLVVIRIQPRLFECFVILANQTVQCVVLVPYHGLAVLVDSADIAHIIVLVLYAFRDREFISALFTEIHRTRHACCMVAYLPVIDILRRKFGIVLPYLAPCVPAQFIRLRAELIRSRRDALQLARGIALIRICIRPGCRSALRYARHLAVFIVRIRFRIFRRFSRFARVARQPVIGVVIGIALRLSAHSVRYRRRFFLRIVRTVYVFARRRRTSA